MRGLAPLRAAPVDGPANGPFPSVRISAGRAPNDGASLALATPTTSASHHRSARSPLSASGSFFVSLRCEKQKTPTGQTEGKNNGISKQHQPQQRIHR